jgi:hypothetical protein
MYILIKHIVGLSQVLAIDVYMLNISLCAKDGSDFDPCQIEFSHELTLIWHASHFFTLGCQRPGLLRSKALWWRSGHGGLVLTP